MQQWAQRIGTQLGPYPSRCLIPFAISLRDFPLMSKRQSLVAIEHPASSTKGLLLLACGVQTHRDRLSYQIRLQFGNGTKHKEGLVNSFITSHTPLLNWGERSCSKVNGKAFAPDRDSPILSKVYRIKDVVILVSHVALHYPEIDEGLFLTVASSVASGAATK